MTEDPAAEVVEKIVVPRDGVTADRRGSTIYIALQWICVRTRLGNVEVVGKIAPTQDHRFGGGRTQGSVGK